MSGTILFSLTKFEGLLNLVFHVLAKKNLI